jgi:hypothetical protein
MRLRVEAAMTDPGKLKGYSSTDCDRRYSRCVQRSHGFTALAESYLQQLHSLRLYYLRPQDSDPYNMNTATTLRNFRSLFHCLSTVNFFLCLAHILKVRK